jgi:hypothetical protein
MTSQIASEIRKIADQMMDYDREYQTLVGRIPFIWNDGKEKFLKELYKSLLTIHKGKFSDDQLQRFLLRAQGSQGLIKPKEARLLFHTFTFEKTDPIEEVSFPQFKAYFKSSSKYALRPEFDLIFETKDTL